MPYQEERFEVVFPKSDANRIRAAAAALGMSEEEYIRWATRIAMEHREWLPPAKPTESD